ncbi:hypothetical protein ACIQAC_24945 [Streptomyces sp. NPDC088387]|uniref:hypothetical protein n=1 Tax=Streptomyces sp. NPDC088387 TaxID=3365859 RepID=UPI0037FE816A
MNWGAIRRRFALFMAVLTASGLLALTGPADEAQAAADETRAAAPCGGRKVKTLPFSTGSVRLYRRGGYICAITVPKRVEGRKTMSVSLQARGNRPVVDKGRYVRRAGPVTVHAGRRCVRVKGAVGGGSVSSGWILC